MPENGPVPVAPDFKPTDQRLKTIFDWIRQTVHHLKGKNSVDTAYADLLNVMASPEPTTGVRVASGRTPVVRPPAC